VDRDSAWWQSDTMEAEVNSEHPAAVSQYLNAWADMLEEQLLEDEARRADGDSHENLVTHSSEKSASNFGQCGVEGHASEQLAADTTSMFKHGSGSVTSMQPQQVSSPATVHSFIAHPQPLFRIEFEQGKVASVNH
jgi:hypothetical protein